MLFAGVDLGGTSIKSGLVSEKGKILVKETIPTPVEEGFEGVVKAINTSIEMLFKSSKIKKEEVKAVGIGVPGTCSKEGMVYRAPNLFWENVPLSARLKAISGWDTYIENDAAAAALAEYAIGATKEALNSVLITLGTGVGGGFIIDGRIYSGSYGMGSEIGHMIIGENFYDCNCGSNGCLETYASATAIVKYSKKLLEENDNSMIIDKVKGNMGLINAKLIFDCAQAGDIIAQKVIERFIKYLAIGIGNIINILDPEIIAVGGGLSGAGEYLLKRLEKEVLKYVFNKNLFLCKIVLAQLGNDAGLIGSALFAKLQSDN